MSSFDNRQSGPPVYNYSGTDDRNSYIAGQTLPQNTINVHRTSNVEVVKPQQNVSNIQTVQPIVATNPNVNVQKTSQFKGSRAAEIVSSDKRFANYHINEYKYNLFSLIDEPWNRCLQIGKCGSCPGNECIARQSRRGLWQWN